MFSSSQKFWLYFHEIFRNFAKLANFFVTCIIYRINRSMINGTVRNLCNYIVQIVVLSTFRNFGTLIKNINLTFPILVTIYVPVP